MRRGLEPGVITDLGSTTGMDGMDNWFLMLVLILSTIAFLFISVGIFRFADKTARRKGKIDWTTAY